MRIELRIVPTTRLHCSSRVADSRRLGVDARERDSETGGGSPSRFRASSSTARSIFCSRSQSCNSLAPRWRGRLLRCTTSGVRYQREPFGREWWQTALDNFTEGEGDCEDLASHRAAELNVFDGEPARTIAMHTGERSFHAVVRRADGPSKTRASCSACGRRASAPSEVRAMKLSDLGRGAHLQIRKLGGVWRATLRINTDRHGVRRASNVDRPRIRRWQ